MAEPFPVWITRYCLGSGIEEATAWEVPGGNGWCVVASGRMKNAILQDGQWFRTRSEAVKEANKVLARAIRSQRERLEELESVCFTEDDNEQVGAN